MAQEKPLSEEAKVFGEAYRAAASRNLWVPGMDAARLFDEHTAKLRARVEELEARADGAFDHGYQCGIEQQAEELAANRRLLDALCSEIARKDEALAEIRDEALAATGDHEGPDSLAALFNGLDEIHRRALRALAPEEA